MLFARRAWQSAALVVALLPHDCLGNASTGASVASSCKTLGKQFAQSVVFPNNTAYSTLSTENWSETSWDMPTCIFQPSSVSDLQTAVRLFDKSNTPYALRSGGHSPSPGAANIGQGVLVDLSGFNTVTYDAAKGTARVGAGQRWGNVYSQLAAFNVTVVGGRELDVGVGGLILGGGLSYLSDLHGLACDSVVNFELVLANGSLVNADKHENADLFWALKGGGNNFGVVTAFDLTTYPIGQVWGGLKGYTLDDLPELLDAVLEYQTAREKDPYANLFMQGYPINETFGVVLTLVYLKPEANPSVFEPFYHINTTFDTTTLSSYYDFLNSSALSSTLPPRIDWFTSTFLTPSKSFYDKVQSIVRESTALDQIRSVIGGSTSFSIQPISDSVVKAGLARGGNPLGLVATNQTWFKVDSGWLFSDDDATIHRGSRQLIGEVASAAKDAGIHNRYLFMNDASWDDPVIESYGNENVRKLKAVRKKYDPEAVFQRLVPGGFKLPS